MTTIEQSSEVHAALTTAHDRWTPCLIDPGVLDISSEHEGDRYVVALSGELDLAGVGPVDEALRSAEATDARSIVMDLSLLDFMDASGVALLVRADSRSRADSNRLSVIRPPRQVMRVLQLTGVADTLPFAR